MTHRVLTQRELNRTLLARQLLIERAHMGALEAVEKLVGLQAQVPNPPYIGLWTRLHHFQRDDLTQLMEQRLVVRSSLMRSTLHLMTAVDFLRVWTTLQPALVKALNAFFSKQVRSLDVPRLVPIAQAYFQEPHTFADLKKVLLAVQPDQEPEGLVYAVKTQLPLVQVPPAGRWGSGSVVNYALADLWLGQPVEAHDNLKFLVERYLQAFGPASVNDFQTWAGLTKLKEPFEKLKHNWMVYKDEKGRELFDLPDMRITDAEVDAPIRFVPEYDNLVLAHQDRSLIISDDYRKHVFLSAARVRSTFLIDGFVEGAWKVEKSKTGAVLVIEPFRTLSGREKGLLEGEGARLVQFIEDRAEKWDIRFAE